MPQDPSISFGNFWQRFGLRGQTDKNQPPEIIPSIQPVVIAADAGRMGPYFDMPCGIWGGAGAAVLAQFCAITLFARNPGGILLEWWTTVNRPNASSLASVGFQWVIATFAAYVAAGGSSVIGSVISVNPNRPTQAFANTYHGASNIISPLAAPADIPEYTGGDEQPTPQIAEGNKMGPVWIPQGSGIIVQTSSVARGMDISGWFYELPAISPPPP